MVARLQLATAVFVPTPTVGELEAAFLNGTRPRENQAILDAFLDEPLVQTIEIDRRVARRYGALYSKLKKAGTPIPINDVWIAACAAESGARLLTFDRDFRLIPGLDLELLVPPRR